MLGSGWTLMKNRGTASLFTVTNSREKGRENMSFVKCMVLKFLPPKFKLGSEIWVIFS
jgi:hypothetical protein